MSVSADANPVTASSAPAASGVVVSPSGKRNAPSRPHASTAVSARLRSGSLATANAPATSARPAMPSSRPYWPPGPPRAAGCGGGRALRPAGPAELSADERDDADGEEPGRRDQREHERPD